MKPTLVAAGHGFVRAAVDAGPTHAARDAFLSWLDRCLSEGVAFTTPAAFERSILENQIVESLPDSVIRPRVLLTFDDALASIDTVVEIVPAPGVIFVVSDYAGRTSDWPSQPARVPRERCLSWSRLRELSDRGWAIAAHTRTHSKLNSLTPQEQWAQIEGSRRSVEDRIGKPCIHFAYPYGICPPASRAMIRKAGMIGFGTRPGIVRETSPRDRLPRIDLYDLIRPGLASAWAWKSPSPSRCAVLSMKRTLARFKRWGTAA